MVGRNLQILLLLVAFNFCCQQLTVAPAANFFYAYPVADAFVATGPTGNLSANNYGGDGALGIAHSGLPNGEFQTVLKFDLSGARDSVNAQFGIGKWSFAEAVLQLSVLPPNNAIYNANAAGFFGI